MENLNAKKIVAKYFSAEELEKLYRRGYNDEQIVSRFLMSQGYGPNKCENYYQDLFTYLDDMEKYSAELELYSLDDIKTFYCTYLKEKEWQLGEKICLANGINRNASEVSISIVGGIPIVFHYGDRGKVEKLNDSTLGWKYLDYREELYRNYFEITKQYNLADEAKPSLRICYGTTRSENEIFGKKYFSIYDDRGDVGFSISFTNNSLLMLGGHTIGEQDIETLGIMDIKFGIGRFNISIRQQLNLYNLTITDLTKKDIVTSVEVDTIEDVLRIVSNQISNYPQRISSPSKQAMLEKSIEENYDVLMEFITQNFENSKKIRNAFPNIKVEAYKRLLISAFDKRNAKQQEIQKIENEIADLENKLEQLTLDSHSRGSK